MFCLSFRSHAPKSVLPAGAITTAAVGGRPS